MTDPCKNNALPGQNGMTVVASLPTSPSPDVTANIPMQCRLSVAGSEESREERLFGETTWTSFYFNR